jgi:hypothetical protein
MDPVKRWGSASATISNGFNTFAVIYIPPSPQGKFITHLSAGYALSSGVVTAAQLGGYGLLTVVEGTIQNADDLIPFSSLDGSGLDGMTVLLEAVVKIQDTLVIDLADPIPVQPGAGLWAALGPAFANDAGGAFNARGVLNMWGREITQGDPIANRFFPRP